MPVAELVPVGPAPAGLVVLVVVLPSELLDLGVVLGRVL